MTIDSLLFNDHLDFYKKLFVVRGEPQEFVLRKAWHSHSITVFDPLRDLGTQAIVAANKLLSKEARSYLQYGAGRRLLAIWYSYRSITHIAHPERKEPLSESEAHEINKDINLIYMHLRGVLDNYAWVYIFEKEPNLLKTNKGKARKNVGLFNKDFAADSSNKAFWLSLNKYAQWANEMSDKRDPVAHRIPLYVVPSVVTPDQAQQYETFEKQQNDALKELDFNKVAVLTAQQRKLGSFPMVFAHNPYEAPIPIYPTIPQDMAQLIAIQKVVFQELGLI